MYIKNLLPALVALTAVTEAVSIRPRSPFSTALRQRQDNNDNNGGGNNNDNNNNDGGNNNGGNNNGGNNNGGNNGGGGGTTLSDNAIQTGSQQDGNDPPADGQSASATDDANFINFCDGQDLTNGEQKEGGSCNGIPMGKIPSTDRMVASVFTNPQNGDDIAADTDFNIDLQMINLAAGSFTNAQTTYYSAPQDLDGNGQIIGHTHVTVQDTGNDLNPTTPLNPQEFVFFKGINDAGDGNGLLSAAVEGGLPAGNYRLCSMSSSSNHQPVLMPVAQRGAQDDCIRFTVSAGGGGGNNGDANNGDANNGDANNGDANNGDANNGDANNGDANNGDANNGDANNGDANNGDANNGDANNGDANNGDANNGDANNGDANNGDANNADANGDANNGDANNGDAGNGGDNVQNQNEAVVDPAQDDQTAADPTQTDPAQADPAQADPAQDNQGGGFGGDNGSNRRNRFGRFRGGQ